MADQRDHDRAVLLELGRAVAQAQELERVMTRVLEAREYNLADPLDDRWEQVHWWLWRNAGASAHSSTSPTRSLTSWKS
jgi:hypothetical protein